VGEYSEGVARLLGNSAFFQFAVAYLADKPDKVAAARAFVVDDSAIKAFRSRVVANKWLTADEIDAALANAGDRRDIEIALRSEVLNAGVSLTEGYRAFIESDEQVQAALKYFDEAAKLQARARTGSVPVQAAAQADTPPRS
jgi:hypothetical protein